MRERRAWSRFCLREISTFSRVFAPIVVLVSAERASRSRLGGETTASQKLHMLRQLVRSPSYVSRRAAPPATRAARRRQRIHHLASAHATGRARTRESPAPARLRVDNEAGRRAVGQASLVVWLGPAAAPGPADALPPRHRWAARQPPRRRRRPPRHRCYCRYRQSRYHQCRHRPRRAHRAEAPAANETDSRGGSLPTSAGDLHWPPPPTRARARWRSRSRARRRNDRGVPTGGRERLAAGRRRGAYRLRARRRAGGTRTARRQRAWTAAQAPLRRCRPPPPPRPRWSAAGASTCLQAHLPPPPPRRPGSGSGLGLESGSDCGLGSRGGSGLGARPPLALLALPPPPPPHPHPPAPTLTRKHKLTSIVEVDR